MMRSRPAIRAWTLAVLWMAVIFYFSTESFSSTYTTSFIGSVLPRIFPSVTARQIAALNLSIRKLGHFSEFFILAVLLFRAVLISTGQNTINQSATRTVMGAFLYAFSDEWHQSFVPGRTASFGDVMIDTIGALGGVMFLLWRYRVGWNTVRPESTEKHRARKKT